MGLKKLVGGALGLVTGMLGGKGGGGGGGYTPQPFIAPKNPTAGVYNNQYLQNQSPMARMMAQRQFGQSQGQGMMNPAQFQQFSANQQNMQTGGQGMYGRQPTQYQQPMQRQFQYQMPQRQYRPQYQPQEQV